MRSETKWKLFVKAGVLGCTIVLGCGIVYWWATVPRRIHRAAFRGDAQQVRELIEKGVDVNKPAPKFDGEVSRRMTPIMWAVDGNQAEIITILHSAGATVDTNELNTDSPIFWAIFWRHTDALRALLECGVSTEITNDHQGQTPLHIALEYRYFDGAVLLLRNGADPTVVDHYGNTPLQLAHALFSGIESDELIKLAILSGADVNARIDGAGRTCLMWAVAGGNEDLVRFLLDAGADASLVDDEGATVFDYLEEHPENEQLRQILHSLGSESN